MVRQEGVVRRATQAGVRILALQGNHTLQFPVSGNGHSHAHLTGAKYLAQSLATMGTPEMLCDYSDFPFCL